VAKREGDGWVINGSKRWITNASEAQAYVVAAITDPARRSRRGISLFLVEAGTPGLICDKVERKMGMNNSPTGSLLLKNCYVPKSSLIGEENGGYQLVQTACRRDAWLFQPSLLA
jgi:alkylation response protein AidB-like acyl-CoA dehydrogenase